MAERADAQAGTDSETLAVGVLAGGVGALVLGWLLGFRLLRALGLVAALAGGGLYARARLAERREKMDEAETAIRSELAELDPVARAQVLKDIIDPTS